MTRPRRVLLAAIAAASVAVACSSSAPTPSPTGGTTAGVPEVLDFEAPLLDGGTLRGADLAGKDVAFWFWAPW